MTSTMDALSDMITPLLGGDGLEHPIDSRFHPIPDFPPSNVKTIHFHGGPTTEDTQLVPT